MMYHSTRGSSSGLRFDEVLTAGLAPDGGLYVPQNWPRIELGKSDNYIDIAEQIITPFVAGYLEPEELRSLLHDTYSVRADGFTTSDVTPIITLDDHLHMLELFHGPTLAFKDVALQLLGRLLDHNLKKTNRHITIIGATSGDTGSAAIEGCKNCANARIVILHPHNRTSEVQRRQMTCVTSPNVHNIAIEGSFDDCQAIVKSLFHDTAFRSEQNLTAVNSINWARIMAQCVYYAVAIQRLRNHHLRFCVPTGNFGNIYAAHVMRQCGLPIEGLIIASNRNDILTRFFETGVMELRDVEPSLSPSMDIQISSNFERLLFEHMGASALKQFMDDFKTHGRAEANPAILNSLRTQFTALRCNDAQTSDMIQHIHNKTGMILDPHTAVGAYAAMQSHPSADHPIVTLACAHPAKFPDAVKEATGEKPDLPPAFSDLFEREERMEVLPASSDRVKNFIERL